MKVANLTIKQMGAICNTYRESEIHCNEKCPFLMTVDTCFLARRCRDAMDDKSIEHDIDTDCIKTVIDEDFYMNRFMEVK